MGKFRSFIFWLFGARFSRVITVGSQMKPSGQQNVALTVKDGLRRADVGLSPDGARRIASQLNEWADAADKNNSELMHTKLVWKYVTKNDAETEVGGGEQQSPATTLTMIEHKPMPPSLTGIVRCEACDENWPCEVTRLRAALEYVRGALDEGYHIPLECQKAVREALKSSNEQ